MSSIAMAMALLPGLVIGLTFHEFAHAWVASLLGDKYPRRQGRVSLNPFRHLSLLGTLAMFILRFGWGKPVMINLYNFKHPKRDFLLCSLAGPVANLIIVAACILAMQFTRHTYAYGQEWVSFMQIAHLCLFLIALINTILATVNMLPVPPLDGSKIWPCLIPAMKPSFGRKTTWICVILLIAAVQTDSLSPILDAAMGAVRRILPVSDGERFDEKFASGYEAYDDERYAEADTYLTRALAINPWSSEALHWRMAARMDMGRYDEARADIDRAIDQRPYAASQYDLRADLLTRLNRPDEAKRDRRTAEVLRRLSGEKKAPPPASQPATREGDAGNAEN